MDVRTNVLKALEEARNKQVIGKSFAAKLTLYPENEVKELLESLNANLGQIFIVSKFEMKEGKGEYEFNNLSIDYNEYKTKDGFPKIPYHRESRRSEGMVTLTLNDIKSPFERLPVIK